MAKAVAIRRNLSDPRMEVMNFLNEASERHPSAISFAAGRPPQELVSADATARWVARYVEHRAEQTGVPVASTWRALGQYGAANGEICDLVARMIAADEGIDADPAEVMITNGMQEAALVLLLGLFERDQDVLLCDEPAYIGIVGAAHVAGVPVAHLKGSGTHAALASSTLDRLKSEGRRGRALYVVPDFSNPSGRTLSLQERYELLEVAERNELLIFEDTVYRPYRYDGEPIPSLRALDRAGVVIQIGTFSKTIMPALRLGYIHANQPVAGEQRRSRPLTQELSKIKSFLSVLTSPLSQAMVGGLLVEHECSMREWLRPRIQLCRSKRDQMLACLQATFGADGGVRWTRPEGGFFVVLETGIPFGRDQLLDCAEKFGVIVCPLSLFSDDPRYQRQVRLAFSNVSGADTQRGVERLSAFLASQRAPRGLSLYQPS